MVQPQMDHKPIQLLKHRRRFIPQRTAENTPERTTGIVRGQRRRLLARNVRLGQKRPAVAQAGGTVRVDRLVDAVVMFLAAPGEGHGEVAAVAAPFGDEGEIADWLAVDFEAAQSRVEFPGAFAEACVAVFFAGGPVEGAWGCGWVVGEGCVGGGGVGGGWSGVVRGNGGWVWEVEGGNLRC